MLMLTLQTSTAAAPSAGTPSPHTPAALAPSATTMQPRRGRATPRAALARLSHTASLLCPHPDLGLTLAATAPSPHLPSNPLLCTMVNCRLPLRQVSHVFESCGGRQRHQQDNHNPCELHVHSRCKDGRYDVRLHASEGATPSIGPMLHGRTFPNAHNNLCA